MSLTQTRFLPPVSSRQATSWPEQRELPARSVFELGPPTPVRGGPRLVMLVNESKHFLSHRLDVARAAVRSGYDVHLITRLMHDPTEIERFGIKVHSLNLPRTLRNPWVEWRTVRKLRKLYQELKPDLLHHFSAKAILLGSLAARQAGTPRVVNTFTGLGAAFAGDGWRALARRQIAVRLLRHLLTPDQWRVTFQNQEDMQQLVAAGMVRPDQCEVVCGSGVDPHVFQQRDEPQGTPVVMLASRMIWPKGIAQFVEAARLLAQSGADARFVLVGGSDSGSKTAVPIEQLRSWDETGVVEWWGNCSNMPETIGLASVVVLPTYYGEGLPKVLLEAAACGKPIVATDVRGCRSVVRDGHNGYLIAPHDLESLCTAIWRLLELPELRRSMGRQGRKIVLDQFTSQRVASQTLGIYQRMGVHGSMTDDHCPPPSRCAG